MPKTKTVEIITGDEVRTLPYRNKIRVVIEEPDIEEMLSSMNKEDILTWVRSEGFKPDEVFEEENLIEWATENGYTKE